MKEYALGIDIGTTSVKVIMVSSEGYIVDETSVPHDLISDYPNWAEEDADIWWENTKIAVGHMYARHPDKMKGLKCIGCSGMVPAIVMLDKDDKPVRKTIQQNDARAVEQISSITQIIDQDKLYRTTGGRTNQQHILPRLLWVKENEPEVWARTSCIMGSYDWITFLLTGRKSLEMNWAVESGAFDIRTKQWLKDNLEQFGISTKLFPEVKASMDIVGKTKAELEEVLGIPKGTPVIAGSADHVASTLAAGITEKGDLLIKFGGAGDILYCVDEIETSEKLFFDYHIVPDKYLLNGCMAASGSLVKWFTKDITHQDSADVFAKLDAEAMKVPPASEGLIILPYFLGEKTPIFDPTARGVMFGLTLSHTNGHIFRAILEAVIYGFRHHIEVLRDMGYEPYRIMATNGGAKSKFWCQIAADVLGSTVRSYPSHPGSALGVAFLAGMSVGMFHKWDEIQNFLTDYRVFEPNPEAVKVYNKSYKIYRNVYQQLRPSFQDIQNLYK